MIVNIWGNIILEDKAGEFTPPNQNVFAQRMFDGVDNGLNNQTADCWATPEEEWESLPINCDLFLEAYYTKDDQMFDRQSNQLVKEFRNPIRFIYPLNVTADRLLRYIELDMKMSGKLKCALIQRGCTSTGPVEQARKNELLSLKNKILNFMLMAVSFGILLPILAMLYAWGEHHHKMRPQGKLEGENATSLRDSLGSANEEHVLPVAALYGGLINISSWVAIAIILV